MRLRILCLTLFAFGLSPVNAQSFLWQRIFSNFHFVQGHKLNADTLIVAGTRSSGDFAGGIRFLWSNGNVICENLEFRYQGIDWESVFPGMSVDLQGNVALSIGAPYLYGTSNFGYNYRLQGYRKNCSTISEIDHLGYKISYVHHTNTGQIEYLTESNSGGHNFELRELNPDFSPSGTRFTTQLPIEMGYSVNDFIATDSVWYLFGGYTSAGAFMKVRNGTNNYSVYTAGPGGFWKVTESPGGDFVALQPGSDTCYFSRVSRTGTLLYSTHIRKQNGVAYKNLYGLYAAGNDQYLMVGQNPFESYFIIVADAYGNVLWEYDVGNISLLNGQPFFLKDSGDEFYLFLNRSGGTGVIMKIRVPAVGIDENQEFTNNLMLSPNPSDGRVVIQNPGTAENLEIFDGQGRLLRTAPFPASEMELDVSGLAPGMYLFRALGENGANTARFIKN